MSSINFTRYRLEEAAWLAPRIVVARVLEAGAFRYPGSEVALAQKEGESLGFLRISVLRTLRGTAPCPGEELRIFNAEQWDAHVHALLRRAGVISTTESHYDTRLSADAIAPGMELLCFLSESPAPPKFPEGAVFGAFIESFDRADREADVVAALKDGPYAKFHHRIELKPGERVRLPDGLQVRLIGYSHKRSTVAGPKCESTHVELSKDGAAGTLQLNHVTDPDGTQSWGKQPWGPYIVELHGMEYDKGSTIVVRPPEQPSRDPEN